LRDFHVKHCRCRRPPAAPDEDAEQADRLADAMRAGLSPCTGPDRIHRCEGAGRVVWIKPRARTG